MKMRSVEQEIEALGERKVNTQTDVDRLERTEGKTIRDGQIVCLVKFTLPTEHQCPIRSKSAHFEWFLHDVTPFPA